MATKYECPLPDCTWFVVEHAPDARFSRWEDLEAAVRAVQAQTASAIKEHVDSMHLGWTEEEVRVAAVRWRDRQSA